MANTGVSVLEDSDNREPPSEEEIREYAEFIGIEPDKEPDLLWIAEEGVSAPVPKPWKACSDADGEIFYFNFETEESVWDHPMDDHYKDLVTQAREKKAKGGSPLNAGTAGKTEATAPSAAIPEVKSSSIPEADEEESDEVEEDIPSGSEGSEAVSSRAGSPTGASQKSSKSPAASPAGSPTAVGIHKKSPAVSPTASPAGSPAAAGGKDAKSPGVSPATTPTAGMKSPTGGAKLAPLKAPGTLAPLDVTQGMKTGASIGVKESVSDDGSAWDDESNASPEASPSGKSISGAISPDPSPSASKSLTMNESVAESAPSPAASPMASSVEKSAAASDQAAIGDHAALEAQVDALEKIFEGLKDIRLKQAMYLQRLRFGPTGVAS